MAVHTESPPAGVSQLERFIAQLRSRVEERLWFTLGRSVTGTAIATARLADGGRRQPQPRLDQLRSGPVMVSGPALIRALRRLDDVRGIGITCRRRRTSLPAVSPPWPASPTRPRSPRLIGCRRRGGWRHWWPSHSAEATAHDDALEVLEALLRDLFSNAEKADKKARMRSLKDLDRSAATPPPRARSCWTARSAMTTCAPGCSTTCRGPPWKRPWKRSTR